MAGVHAVRDGLEELALTSIEGPLNDLRALGRDDKPGK
jgi:hypothetical protein